ncbi:MAG: aminopeptidase [Bacilli bacterium]|nr:aminopeptidase [Bacilli bacterium]
MKEVAWKKYKKKDLDTLNELADDYKDFITNAKTEREIVKEVITRAKECGFVNLNDYINDNREVLPGDKIYVNNRGKSIALFVIGEEDLEDGMNILGAHVDSPRLDLKANPLYETEGLSYFDTHYYGGIKKYQWVTIPLALHGVVVKKDGEKVNICIGENSKDPVLGITDLLPHLAMEQMKKEASKVVDGENLDLLIGSIPINDEDKENQVKRTILKILKDKYDIEEEDLLSSELEVVPAGSARDFGLDRSMIMAYGQDDKVCAFASLKAFLEVENPKKTISCILVDKEEIGSVGSTGMESSFYENAINEIHNLLGNDSISTNRTLSNSYMLSSDVNSAYDPLYADVMDKNNSSYLGRGLEFNKYTGSRGKYDSNDADAEYIAKIRKVMDDNDISYGIAELGKVDIGGGGTIAYILANKCVHVIDAGVPVLSMHAPWEVTSKADIYEAYKGYIAFLEDM